MQEEASYTQILPDWTIDVIIRDCNPHSLFYVLTSSGDVLNISPKN